MLRVTESNRLEVLAERLAATLDAPGDTPLAPDLVVVPNRGMARWLSLWIARDRGVCANVRFDLPAEFIWSVLGRAFGQRANADVFDPAVLAWRVLGVLARLERRPPFTALHAYIDGPSDRRRYDLARRIANVFDQYLVYRPDWIRRWEAGGDDHWQAELWRRLVAGSDASHRVTLLDTLVAALEGGRLARAELPSRVRVFAVAAMPPAYLAVFGRLAERIDVDLYALNPSPTYWGDLMGSRELARRPLAAGDEDLARGNSLLAGFGKQLAELRDLVREWNAHEIEAHVEPSERSILGAVQADIHHLRTRGMGATPKTPRPDDGTIQVHRCHGPMREVEVLHDQLLALFDRHPDLQPSDVVVMTPDIETYAPCIEAVFGTAPRERMIPFTIADRSARAERPTLGAFLGLLALPASRYDANSLLALLDVDAVRRRFGFADAEVARARRWVRATGIRWGVDATTRAALGLPATHEHTWRFGLDRLLLGYALPEEERRRFAEVLPYDDVEGTSARALGLLATFAEACFALGRDLGEARAPLAWTTALGEVVDRFFDAAEADEEDVVTIRRALTELAAVTRRAGFADAVSFDVVRAYLETVLAAPVASGRFLAGRVTFCALVPMRSIPFEVVCLLGLDDGAFPRQQRPMGFDLMADDFRPGDRSRREDDRSLFLEAILSARRVLYLSYVGRDIRDNSERPPSVLVRDLVDYVRCGFGAEVEQTHPLQPFSASYFTPGGTLFSYADDLCAARRLQGTRVELATPFVLQALPAPDGGRRTLSVDDLVRFFLGPAKFLLQERLGLRLEPARGVVDTREPFVLDALSRYLVRDQVLRLWREGTPLTELEPLLRGAGLLPHGAVGEVTLRQQTAGVEDLLARLDAALPTPRLAPTPVDVLVGDFRLHGAISTGRGGGVVDYRPTVAKAKDRLALWIRHLVLASATGRDAEGRWFGTHGDVVLRPPAEPREVLAELLALYWDGLRRPLPFFPRSSYALCTSRGGSLAGVHREWNRAATPQVPPGESEDPYNELAFRGATALGDEFRSLAHRVVGPLLDHQVEDRS